MSQLIFTTKGLLPLEELEIHDIIELHENARVIATEWRKDGEVVRRDVNVNILRGLDLNGSQATI